MTTFSKILPAGGIALLLTTTGALAQVTAQQVWDDFKASSGMGVTEGLTVGSESYANGVLTVTDFGFAYSDETGSASGSIGQVLFTEQADGTVLVTMSDSMPITFSGSENGGTVAGSITLNQSGLAMVASGAPGAMTYDLTADRYEVVFGEFTENGQPTPFEAVIGLNAITGNYVTSGADLRAIDSSMAADSMDLKVAFSEGSDSFTLSGLAQAITAESSGAVPADFAELANPFAAGLATAGSLGFGASEYTFTATDAMGATNGQITLTGGAFDFELSKDLLDYSTTFAGLDISANSAMLPFPVNLAASELGVRLMMPMSKTETPADFALRVNLADLTVNEEVWSMVDPSAALPRDPATVRADLSGTATLAVDLTDPDPSSMMGSEAPGEVNSVTLNDLTVIFGGASVTGQGAFTLDNTDLTTFPGMPRPTGEVNLTLQGVNGLLDKLGQLGFVPPDQLMPARMMLGMFTVPVGDDHMTAKIEVTADGALLANGQRLQ